MSTADYERLHERAGAHSAWRIRFGLYRIVYEIDDAEQAIVSSPSPNAATHTDNRSCCLIC